MYSRWGIFSGSAVKNPPAMQKTQVQSLGGEDPLEKEMATHSSILAWRIPWTEKLGGLQSWGRKESDTTERLTHTNTECCFRSFKWQCLENPMDGGAW